MYDTEEELLDEFDKILEEYSQNMDCNCNSQIDVKKWLQPMTI